jgi:NAD(P)-dependent dehydrogenase (short-subunit alcohol dehydrogenase family)
MRKLDGKIALVTGASKGIGAGIALSLAKEGAAVAVNHASDREGADRVVERIRAAGGKAHRCARKRDLFLLPNVRQSNLAKRVTASLTLARQQAL